MKTRNILYLKMFFCLTLLILLCSCGGSGGGGSSASSTDGDDNPQTPPELKTINLSGSGTTITDSFEVTETGNVIFDYSFTGESNAIAWLKDNQGNNIKLLVNEIGNTSGTTDVQLEPGIYHLSIDAEDSTWEFTISGYYIESLGSTSIPVNPEPEYVEITTNLESGVPLSHGGQFTLDAYVTYTITTNTGAEVLRPIPDGTIVNFTIEQGGGIITNSKITQNGIATATYQGGTYGGLVTVKAAVSETVFDTYSFEVAPGDVGSITLDSVSPESRVINVHGTGETNVAQITFAVTDNYGNPVADGKTVFFDLPNPLNGGENLSTSEANTLNGLVSVALQSGEVAGPIAVRAIYSGNEGTSVSTETQITIVSGLPDAKHVSLAAQYLNIGGGVTFGLQDTITTYLGDRYGNVVPDGTSVSFITEGGTIGESTGFTTTTTYGVAEGVLQSSEPTTPDLDGGDGTANPGWCRVVAYARGSESFYDENGNGVFDKNIDTLTEDMSDPYIDANDNGVHDSGELYIDADNDGVFSPADGEYQSDTTIWSSMNVLFSDDIAPLNLSPSSFELEAGECQSFTFNFSDIYGNALVAGTTMSIETTKGELIGLTEFTQADTNGPGFNFSFALCTDPEEEEELIPQITVTVTPPADANTAPGNNGAELIAMAIGTVTPIPEPEPPTPPTPSVVFTLPNADAIDVPVDDSILLVFSEAMDEDTFTGANIYIKEYVDGINDIYYPIDAKVNGSDHSQVELTHRSGKSFNYSSTYVVTLTDNLASEEGQTLEADYTFSFTTAPE